MKKKIALGLSLALVCAMFTGNAMVGNSAAAPIKIGAVMPLTGQVASFGQSAQKGIQMLEKETNKAGGINGRKVQFIFQDDQATAVNAVTVGKKLITDDGVVAIVGPLTSTSANALAPIAQSYKIPMVTGTATNIKVTQAGNYIFRTCLIDPFQGKVVAKFAKSTLKAKKAAVLYNNGDDYSKGLADSFVASFKSAGGSIVDSETYNTGDKDFSAQLTSLKGKNPPAIFVPGYYTEVGLIARQARKLGVHSVLMGGDGWDSEKLWEIGGEALNGGYFSNHYSVDNPSPMIQGFVTSFKNRWHETPDAMAALGYDATKILIDAIRRAGTDDPKVIRDSLATTKGFSGITGNITLDPNRDAIKAAVVLEVHDGKFVYKETVDP